ncbi:hypothetical protein CYLTODRAFT_218084 [Cylindrobasidium torrendii FP15055 ss-10]|uniref:Methyltransferase domain-containing protein n=1 Tax=Cylindrobasidium torrendii FP15055 ss-10 TaxID=1314674 RepID=A0A0D7BSJ5_9AGAR|nr:hypothetical protein CYLTODRAFT_218084 [Cylindrobasidium torrendii FP15055 ss-10]
MDNSSQPPLPPPTKPFLNAASEPSYSASTLSPSYNRSFSQSSASNPAPMDGPLVPNRASKTPSMRGAPPLNKKPKDDDFVEPRPVSPRKDSDASRFSLPKALAKKRSFAQLFQIGNQSDQRNSSAPTTPTLEIPPALARDSSSSTSSYCSGRDSESSSSSLYSGVSSAATTPPPSSPTEEKMAVSLLPPSPTEMQVRPAKTIIPKRSLSSIKSQALPTSRPRSQTSPQTPLFGDGSKDSSEVPPPLPSKTKWRNNRFASKVADEPCDYVRSFEHVDLENDRHFELLLRRFYPPNSPLFFPVSKDPLDVLDMGCGEGNWLRYAASFWPSTNFIGVDIVDTMTPHITGTTKMRFQLGDVTKPWNFPTNTFDVVRLADMSMAIKHQTWAFVLGEAYRVLRRGGQLELVDDQIEFPKSISQFGYDSSRSTSSSGAPSSSRSTSPQPPRRGSSSQQCVSPNTVRGSSFFDMDDATSSEEDGDESDSGDSEQTPTTSRQLAMASRASPDDLLIEDEVINEHSWELRMQEAQDLEAVFTNMLGHKGYPVYTTTTLASAIRDVFGPTSLIAPKGRSVHLKLAPPGLTVDGVSMCKNQSTVSLCDEDIGEQPSTLANASNTGTIRKWMDRKKSNARRDLYDVMEDRQSTDSHSNSDSPPSFLSVDSKAAGRLGLTAADLSGAQQQARRRPSNPLLASSYNSNASTSTQSPGVIAWPHTFIPMSAAELEMHACKHMHTLIGCKLAIINYVQQFIDSETQEDIGPDDATMLHELSEYESFRRERFDWPKDLPSTHCSSPEHIIIKDARSVSYPGRNPKYRHPMPVPPGVKRDVGPFGMQELLHLRSIRAWAAIKPTRSSKDMSIDGFSAA